MRQRGTEEPHVASTAIHRIDCVLLSRVLGGKLSRMAKVISCHTEYTKDPVSDVSGSLEMEAVGSCK